MAGDGITWKNRELVSAIDKTGRRSEFRLLGPRNDIPAIMSSFDVLINASISEAFPLVVGEAMACGVPCIVTDVGDSANIVGNTGQIVPAGDSKQLVSAISQVTEMDPNSRRELGRKARLRIESLHSIDTMAQNYLRLYESLRR